MKKTHKFREYYMISYLNSVFHSMIIILLNYVEMHDYKNGPTTCVKLCINGNSCFKRDPL